MNRSILHVDMDAFSGRGALIPGRGAPVLTVDRSLSDAAVHIASRSGEERKCKQLNP